MAKKKLEKNLEQKVKQVGTYLMSGVMKKKLDRRIKKVKDYLAIKDVVNLARLIHNLHPVDLGEIFNHLNREEREAFFILFESEEAACVLPEMNPTFQKEILEKIENVRLARILEVMPSDNAADILGNLAQERVKPILKLMSRREAREVSRLLGYKEDTAGGIMIPEFFSLSLEMTAAEAIEELRKTDIRHISYIYITTDGGYLVGVLPLRDLITADSSTKLSEIVNKDIVRVRVESDQEEVANLVRKYNLRAIPVVDETNKLVGVVTVDDVLDVVVEEASEDIYRMAGVRVDDGLLHRPIPVVTRLRLPWLIICLMGGMVAAGIVGTFEETLAAVVVLAAFIPVIMGMGGNIGTQSSTIVVRGLATGSINIRNIWGVLWRELRIGLLIGAICGIVIGIIAQIWRGVSDLGIVVGISMAATITVAAFLGALLPIVFQRCGVDPAIASGPAITTVKDITALLIYFGVATLIML
jgi:magnesium transporter